MRARAITRGLPLLAVACLLSGAAAPRPVAETPASDTARALRLLLAASATPIASGSSCDAAVAGKARHTLADVLADKLTGFAEGDNWITGGCAGGRCRVVLTHKGGEEDLFQFEYRFREARGKLVPDSLSCFGA